MKSNQDMLDQQLQQIQVTPGDQQQQDDFSFNGNNAADADNNMDDGLSQGSLIATGLEFDRKAAMVDKNYQALQLGASIEAIDDGLTLLHRVINGRSISTFPQQDEQHILKVTENANLTRQALVAFMKDFKISNPQIDANIASNLATFKQQTAIDFVSLVDTSNYIINKDTSTGVLSQPRVKAVNLDPIINQLWLYDYKLAGALRKQAVETIQRRGQMFNNTSDVPRTFSPGIGPGFPEIDVPEVTFAREIMKPDDSQGKSYFTSSDKYKKYLYGYFKDDDYYNFYFNDKDNLQGQLGDAMKSMSQELFYDDTKDALILQSYGEVWDSVYLPMIDMIDLYKRGAAEALKIPSNYSGADGDISQQMKAGFYGDNIFLGEIPREAAALVRDLAAVKGTDIQHITQDDYRNAALASLGLAVSRILAAPASQRSLAIPLRFAPHTVLPQQMLPAEYQRLLATNPLATITGSTETQLMLSNLANELENLVKFSGDYIQPLTLAKAVEVYNYKGDVVSTANSMPSLIRQFLEANEFVSEKDQMRQSPFVSLWQSKLAAEIATHGNSQVFDKVFPLARFDAASQLTASGGAGATPTDPIAFLKDAQQENTVFRQLLENIEVNLDQIRNNEDLQNLRSNPRKMAANQNAVYNAAPGQQMADIDTIATKEILCAICSFGFSDSTLENQKFFCGACKSPLHKACRGPLTEPCPMCQAKDVSMFETKRQLAASNLGIQQALTRKRTQLESQGEEEKFYDDNYNPEAVVVGQKFKPETKRQQDVFLGRRGQLTMDVPSMALPGTSLTQIPALTSNIFTNSNVYAGQGLDGISKANEKQEEDVNFNIMMAEQQIRQPTLGAALLDSTMGAYPVTKSELDTTRKVLQFVSKNVEGDLIADMTMQTQMKNFINYADQMNRRLGGQKTKQILLSEKVRSAGENLAEAIVRNEQNLQVLQQNTQELGSVQQQLTQFKEIDLNQRKQTSEIKNSTTKLQALVDKIQQNMNDNRFGISYDKEILLKDVAAIVTSLPQELNAEKNDLAQALLAFQAKDIADKEAPGVLGEELLDILARFKRIQNIREKNLADLGDTGTKLSKLKTRLKELEMDAGVAVQSVNQDFLDMGLPQYTSQNAQGPLMVDFMKIFQLGTDELKILANSNSTTISTFDKQSTTLKKLHQDQQLYHRELRKIVIDSLNHGITGGYFTTGADLADARNILTQLTGNNQLEVNAADVNRLLDVMAAGNFNLKASKYDIIANKEKIQRYQTEVKKAEDSLSRISAQYKIIREEAKQTNDELKRKGVIQMDFLLDRDFQMADLDRLRKQLQEQQATQSDDKLYMKMNLQDVKQMKTDLILGSKELQTDQQKIQSILGSMKTAIAKTSYEAKAENVADLNLSDIRGELIKIGEEISKKVGEKTVAQETYLELVQQNILLKQKRTELEKTKVIAEGEKIRKGKKMLDNILANQAIEQIKGQTEVYDTILVEIGQGNYNNAKKVLGIPSDTMAQLTGDIRTFTSYYMDPNNSQTQQKLFVTQNIDADGDINNFFNKQLKQMSTLGAIRTPGFRSMISELQESNSVALSALYKNLALYTFADDIGSYSSDERDAIKNVAEAQLSALIPATRVFEGAVDKIVLLDVRYQNALLHGGEKAKSDLNDVMVTSKIDDAVNAVVNEAKSLKQLATSEKSLSLSKINAFASNMSNQFTKVEKLLLKLGEKNIVLQQRQKIDTISYGVVQSLITSGNLARMGSVSKIEGGGLRALSAAMGELLQRGALNYVMGDAANQNAIQDNHNRLFAILSENNIIDQADQRTAAQNLSNFLKDTTDNFKSDFVDKLAMITSKQFADIYMDIDSKKVGEMMANKKDARLFISNQITPSDVARLDVEAVSEFNVSKMLQQVNEQSDIITQTVSYMRDTIRSKELASEILERGTYKRAGKKSDMVFLGTPVDGLENSKDDLSIVSLAMKQQQIYSLPVENLNRERKVLDKERGLWQKAARQYKLHADEYDEGAMGKMVSDLLSYISINGIPNGFYGRRFHDYLSLNFKTPNPFAALARENTAGLTYDFFKNQKHIVASITAPIYDKMENGIIPSKSDLLRVRALELVQVFMKDQYHRYENTFVEKRVNPDGVALEEPALNNGDYFFENEPRKGRISDGIDFDAIQRTMGEYLRKTRDVMVEYTEGFVEKNMSFLDKVDDMIETRAKEETDVDKYKKTNDKVEKYSQGLKGHIEGLLLKQGLKGFFDNDKPSQQMVRTAQQQMLPRFFDPGARQQQSQNGGLASQQQQQQQQQQQPFMAYRGSEAEQSGDSSKSRLNSNAVKAADGFTQITKEDIGFIQQIRYDTERKTLLFYAESDDASKGGRALTKEEKRRYIRILVILLLNLYISQVKNLSKEKRTKTEGKLLNKYIGSADTTPLISMVNKLADKAAALNENHENRRQE